MGARAVRFIAPRQVSVDKVPLPDVEPGQVMVRTSYSGISSGTEMLAYRGELDPSTDLDESLSTLSGNFGYPFSYGYSCVGVVERGTAAVPDGSTVFTFHPHQDRLVVPESDVVLLSPTASSRDLREATLFPLVETALQLTLDCGPVFEETVVVVGLGPVGLLTALLLGRAGARVVATEPRQWRREVAASVGVTAVDPASVRSALPADGVPLLVESSGAPAALASALGLLAHEGTALVASWYGTKPVPLPLGAEFHRRRLTIRSSQVSTIPAASRGRWTRERRRSVAASLLASLPLAALATTEFPLDGAGDAYAAIDRGDPGLIHVALRYE
jgi:2-desacetyl-2-hydroxyethyl bacteriochlorophyllide A dehydrogenase